MFLESFFDLSMSAMLGCLSLIDTDGIELFFDTPDNIMCSCLTLLFATLIVGFLATGYFVISRNTAELKYTKSVMYRWRIFF